jgi:hypothetical protein
MRVALCSTAKSLSEAYKAHRTLEGVRAHYGIAVSKGTLSRILNRTEGVSWEAEREVRQALGVGARRRYLRPCLSLDPAVRLGQLLDLANECRYELDEKRGVPHE